MNNKKIAFLVIGLPGSGKTTVSQYLSSKYDARHISADRIRAKCLGISREEKDCDFPEDQREYVYSKMAYEAVDILKRHDRVIIDAVYRTFEQRNMLYSYLSSITHLYLLRIWIKCDEPVLMKQL